MAAMMFVFVWLVVYMVAATLAERFLSDRAIDRIAKWLRFK